MKIARITYLFALCPALLAGLTSCGGSSDKLPGQALSYEEAAEYAKKIAPEYNMRTSLSKGADITASIDAFTIDGKVTIPGGEPTNIRFTMPKQDSFKLYIPNDNGVLGALQIREKLSHDIPTNAMVSASKFGGNTVVNMLFNPFFTTFTLSYLHTMISTISDLNIVSDEYSLNGDTFYASYSIPDLKTFTDIVEEYELSELKSVFTVFRGTDGKVALTLAFDKYGYLDTFNLKADSNDIVLIGDSSTPDVETFHGLAKVDLKLKLKQKFYSEDEYRGYAVTTKDSNAELEVRKAEIPEYQTMGFPMRELDAAFVEDALNYYDTILPGYGTDFVIKHEGKTSDLNNIDVSIDGITYKATDFMGKISQLRYYSWKANHAMGFDDRHNFGSTYGRMDANNATRYYYADENFTLFDEKFVEGAQASLFEDIVEIKTASGHKINPVNYFYHGPGQTEKNTMRKNNINYQGFSYLGDYGKMLNINGSDFYEDFSSTLSALPYGYVHYNFEMSDRGIAFNGNETTRSAFAVMADGSSHGILDVYGNVSATGYTSPVIKPAAGFHINPKQSTDVTALKAGLFKTGFIKTMMPEAESELVEATTVNFVDGKDPNNGFTITISKAFLDKYFELYTKEVDTHEAAFGLTDYAIDRDVDTQSSLFMRATSPIDPTKEPFYIDYAMAAANGPFSYIYNKTNGSESGRSLVTIVDGNLYMDDITIIVDKGFAFPKNYLEDYSNVLSYFYNTNFNGEDRIGYSSDGTLVKFLSPFAKLSKDRTEVSISLANDVSEQKQKHLDDLKNFLMENIGKVPTNYYKLIFMSNLESSNNYNYSAKKVQGYLNIIPGADFTYVQILPDYTELIDKDLKFILDI